MESQLDALVGHEIDGYAIEKSLGAGGMARVYLGRDVRLDRYVAFKVIQPQARNDPSYTSRFVKEARAVAGLMHGNIVSIYRFGEADGLYYMAMQYIEGVDLAWVLKDYADDRELMPIEDILRVMHDVAAALDYAHAQGVIHRDIKPANVMLDPGGKAYLMDFGLALKQVEGTYGEIFGTPHYIAPEQAISSAGAVPQSDQYALGVMLYEMLTGSLPFEGDSAMAIAMAHMSETLPSPLEKNPELSPALVAVLEKVLEKEPENRYPSCAALVEALEQAAKAQPTKSSRMSMVSVPKQVEAFRAAHPSLSLPRSPLPHSDIQPSATPQAKQPSPIPTKPAEQPRQTLLKLNKSQERWAIVGVGIFAAVMFGIVAVLVILSTNRNQPPPANDEPQVVVLIVTDTPTTEPEVISSTDEIDTTDIVSGAGIPEATHTPQPTDIPPPTATIEPPTPRPLPPRDTPVPQSWTLMLLANGDDTLYIINVSDPSVPAFRSRQLLLTGENQFEVRGRDWEQNGLSGGECIRLEKNDKAAAPQTSCAVVGTPVTLDGKDRFWKPEFNAFFLRYRDSWFGSCQVSQAQSTGCILTIPFSAAGDG